MARLVFGKESNVPHLRDLPTSWEGPGHPRPRDPSTRPRRLPRASLHRPPPASRHLRHLRAARSLRRRGWCGSSGGLRAPRPRCTACRSSRGRSSSCRCKGRLVQGPLRPRGLWGRRGEENQGPRDQGRPSCAPPSAPSSRAANLRARRSSSPCRRCTPPWGSWGPCSRGPGTHCQPPSWWKGSQAWNS